MRSSFSMVVSDVLNERASEVIILDGDFRNQGSISHVSLSLHLQDRLGFHEFQFLGEKQPRVRANLEYSRVRIKARTRLFFLP